MHVGTHSNITRFEKPQRDMIHNEERMLSIRTNPERSRPRPSHSASLHLGEAGRDELGRRARQRLQTGRFIQY